MTEKRKYDSTVARIAGNLLSGVLVARDYKLTADAGSRYTEFTELVVRGAVLVARQIVAEVQAQAEAESKAVPHDD